MKKHRLFGRLLAFLVCAALAAACLVPVPWAQAAGTARAVIELPSGAIDYTSCRTHLNLYACEAADGVYVLRDNTLRLVSLSTGQTETVHTFPQATYLDGGRYFGSQDTLSSYVAGDVLYYMYNAYSNAFSEDEEVRVVKYDLAAGTVMGELCFPGHIGSAVGVDGRGNIYIGVNDYFSEEAAGADDQSRYGVCVYDPAGQLLASSFSSQREDQVYAFNGFGADGTFYYTGYADYYTWGYHHDMMTLYEGGLLDGQLALRERLIQYLCQTWYYEFQNGAALLDDHYLALKGGTVFDTRTFSDDGTADGIVVSRDYDEELPTDQYDTSAWGPRMLATGRDTLLAYTSGRRVVEYDWQTGERLNLYTTAHFVFSLLPMGDRVAAVETEGGRYYVEVFALEDLLPVTAQVIHLNDTDAYRNHTAAAVRSRWQEAKIDPNTPVFETQPSLQAPYGEGVYTQEMTQSLLDYSNYLRWLGGLTPLAQAGEETVRNAGRGAVVLAASDQFDHEPEKTEAISDMDDAFFEDGYAGTSSSNISWGHNADNAATYMDNIRGFLDDTSNVSAFTLGHRFTFLQRAGYEIAYGTAGNIMCQTVNALDNQFNTTGTVTGVDNNDYAYAWPGAGAFPAEEISPQALWSINLNQDKVNLSNQPLTVHITDLATGQVIDRTDTLGTSRYLGSGMGWFYGMCIYFQGPDTDSLLGKSYLVTLENLADASGLPMTLTYTVSFISAEEEGAAVDKTALRERIARGEEELAQAVVGEEPGQYPPLAAQALRAALDAAAQVADDDQADQLQTAEAIAALEEALESFRQSRITDRSGLEEAIAQADALLEEAYTPISWQRLQSAVEAGRRLPPTAGQDQIDQAEADIRAALEALLPVGTALPGDLDKDEEVTIADVMEACKIMARESAGTDPTDEEIARGDLDGDGEITIADVMEICKILARGG